MVGGFVVVWLVAVCGVCGACGRAGGSAGGPVGEIGCGVGSRQSRSWRGLMDMKVFYYSSLSYLHGGLVAEEGGRWGERVAFCQGASTSLIQAGRVAKEYKLEQVYKGVM